MRQASTPKRFFALALSASILTAGLALSATTASAAEPAAVTASAPQVRSADDATPTGIRDRLERRFREMDQKNARRFA